MRVIHVASISVFAKNRYKQLARISPVDNSGGGGGGGGCGPQPPCMPMCTSIFLICYKLL